MGKAQCHAAQAARHRLDQKGALARGQHYAGKTRDALAAHRIADHRERFLARLPTRDNVVGFAYSALRSSADLGGSFSSAAFYSHAEGADAHSIFWKTTPFKVVFGCASCPRVAFESHSCLAMRRESSMTGTA